VPYYGSKYFKKITDNLITFDKGEVDQKSKRGGKWHFSDRQYTFPTQFLQRAANFSTGKIMGGQNLNLPQNFPKMED